MAMTQAADSNGSASTIQDGALIARMLARDERAWRCFVLQYRGLILYAIRRVLAPFATLSLDAEDAYAVLMSSLLAHDMRKLRAFDTTRGVRLSTWLTVLARNATLDLLRDARRQNRFQDALERNTQPPASTGVVEHVISREEISRVMTRVHQLSARDQAFFDILYVEGAQPPQVAAQMGISIKTVYSKCHKVRGKLQLALEP